MTWSAPTAARMRALGRLSDEVGKGKDGALERALDALSEVEDPLTFASIAELTTHQEPMLARAAAETVVRLFERLLPEHVPGVDAGARRSVWRATLGTPAWRTLRPSSIDAILGNAHLSGERTVPLLAALSMHPSGHVREAAVARLGDTTRAGELPFLLVRANDWVSAVKDVARKALMLRIRADCASQWVDALPVLRYLERVTRAPQQELVSAVFGLLRRPECQPSIELGFRHRSAFARATCMSIGLASADDAFSRRALQSATQDPDWTIRLRAARELDRRDRSTFESLAQRLLHDRSMPVRREVSRVGFDRGWILDAIVRSALFDVHPAARDWGRQRAAALGITPSAEYRAELTRSRSPRASALLGIAEVGDPDDAALIEPFLLAPAAQLRKSAVAAIARLRGDAAAIALLVALSDGCRGVSRLAQRNLSRRLHLLPRDALPRLIAEHPVAHVRAHAIRLLRNFGRWAWLEALLAASFHPDLATSQLANRELLRWSAHYNRGFAAPTPREIEAIVELLGRSEQTLPPAIHRDLASILGSWRR